jgi:hypothetical protein
MIPKSNYLIGGLAVAAIMIGLLPAANGIGASSKIPPDVQVVNRAAKGDLRAKPHLARKSPITIAPTPATNRAPATKPRIMDGCEPSFSPVTVPSMAHIAGRCIG